MAKSKVISPKYFPNTLGLNSYIIVWLLLDKFKCPDWAYAVLITVFIIWLAMYLFISHNQEWKEPILKD